MTWLVFALHLIHGRGLALDDKKPWQSKTLWAGVFVALAPLFPPVGAFVAANPAVAGAVAGAITAALRFITDKKVRF